jgi:hypothetical protein
VCINIIQITTQNIQKGKIRIIKWCQCHMDIQLTLCIPHSTHLIIHYLMELIHMLMCHHTCQCTIWAFSTKCKIQCMETNSILRCTPHIRHLWPLTCKHPIPWICHLSAHQLQL